MLRSIMAEFRRHLRSAGRDGIRRRRSATTAAQELEARMLLSADAALFKDINQAAIAAGSNIDDATVVGSYVFFTAHTADYGRELWKSDGTEAGTVLVKDIRRGRYGSYLGDLTNVNGTLFFTANDGIHGEELWKSDGTDAGTVLVKDIYPGSTSSTPSNFSGSEPLVELNGEVFFVATDPTNGRELWKSDGTEAGTVLVKDIRPGTDSSGVRYIENVDGTLYFGADDGSTGIELWKSDGTTAGTALLKDINTTTTNSSPRGFTPVGGKIVFRAYTPSSGTELWQTDGTAAGTTLLKEISSGSVSSQPEHFTSVGNVVFFEARAPSSGYELWKTDGTAAGTVLVKDIRAGSNSSQISSLTNHNGRLLFRANDGVHGIEVWKSDGTDAGTDLLEDINPGAASSGYGNIVSTGSYAYFSANDGTHGAELWRANSSSSFAQLHRDFRAGVSSSGPQDLTDFYGRLFFSVSDGIHGAEPWISDGNPDTAYLVRDIRNGNSSSRPQHLTEVGQSMFFSADVVGQGRELWVSDATPEGTRLVADINPGGPDSSLTNLTNAGGLLYFQADNGTHGREIWRSDGTSAGTRMVKDVRPGPGHSYANQFTLVNDTVYFTASTSEHGTELWKTDGTEAGTMLVRDIRAGTNSSGVSNLTNVNGTLFFTANDGVNGTELWSSDGTTGGTVLVRDIYSGGNSSNPSQLSNLNGQLVFTARDSTFGQELWGSDGTAAGTSLIRDIVTGSGGSGPDYLTNVNGTLFFRAYEPAVGSELWKSDGTTSGTTLVEDIHAGTSSSRPGSLTAIGSSLFFTARQSDTGYELWKSDGTAATTVLVKDIRPGIASSSINDVTTAAGTLFFTANDGIHGTEVWVSDGTAAGTVAATDENAVRGYRSPYAVFGALNRGWASVATDQYGEELFQIVTTADFGDAATLSSHAENGARHIPRGIRLGQSRDEETDGLPTADASGDDTDGNADEDGVAFSTLIIGKAATITLDIQNSVEPGFADAWIDFNQDGDWDDPGEQVIFSAVVTNGQHDFPFAVPATASAGDMTARVRVSQSGNLAPVGLAPTGEVEDHLITVMRNLTITLPARNGADSWRARRVGADLEIKDLQTALTNLIPLNQVHSLTFNGAANENDTILIDLKNGGFWSLPGGISIDGGLGAYDRVTVIPPTTARGIFAQPTGVRETGELTVQYGPDSVVITTTEVDVVASSSIQQFAFEGTIDLGNNIVQITTSNPITAADYTKIVSGQISSSAPLVLGSGDVLTGLGTISAPVAGEVGSLITASGDMSLGRSTAPNGFFTRGSLTTSFHTVTLHDSNQAVLGSLTSLGNATTAGTISAANGLLVDFGNNVTGYGTLDTPNDPAKQIMINGAVAGTSSSQPITLPGYIKGVGSLDNVNITGTYSPGFSPAVSYSGSITYGAGSTTIMEIGGTTPGSSGHDQIIHAGTATLGGTLDIQLINGFTPVANDSFVLMTAETIAGAFSTVDLPTLPEGLTWNVTTSGTAVTVEVVTNEQPPGTAPTITSPAATTQSIRPTLTWDAVTGATEYEVWVKNQSTDVNPFFNVTVSGTSYTHTADFGIGRFNLWVRAKNAHGAGPWTSQYNFSINTRASMDDPGRFQSTHRPTLTWPALPGAATYDLWINDKLGGVSQFIRDQNISGTTWTPTEDMPLGLYQAWIRGIAADGTAGGWSVTTLFYVMPSPTMTAGMNPTFDRTPTFEWDSLLGAVEYEIFIRDRNTGGTALYERNIAAESFTVPSALADGPYRAWVIGVSDDNVRSFWTDPMDIYIGGRTDILTPNGTTGDTTPTFNWRPVDGVARYDLWVDQIGVQNQIIREQNLTTTSFTPVTSLPNGNYRVWVRAISTAGETADWSQTVLFTIAELSLLPDNDDHSQQQLAALRLPLTADNEQEVEPGGVASPGPEPGPAFVSPQDTIAATFRSASLESPSTDRVVPAQSDDETAVETAMLFAAWGERPLTGV